MDELELTVLNDDIYGDLDGKGDCALPIVIPPRGTEFCRFQERVIGNAGRVVTDVITAEAVNGRGQAASAADDASVEIFDLALEVAAGEPTCAECNRSAPFNYLKQGPSF